MKKRTTSVRHNTLISPSRLFPFRYPTGLACRKTRNIRVSTVSVPVNSNSSAVCTQRPCYFTFVYRFRQISVSVRRRHSVYVLPRRRRKHVPLGRHGSRSEATVPTWSSFPPRRSNDARSRRPWRSFTFARWFQSIPVSR